MNTTTLKNREISGGDRWSLAFFAIVGGVTAVWSVVAAAGRIIEVLPNTNVEVLAVFRGTPASAALGPDGAQVVVQLEEAVLTVPSLPIASLWSIVIQQALMAATIVTVVICLVLLIRNVMKGRVFDTTSTRFVATAGITAVIGYAAYPFFGNMAANGAFATLSDQSFDNVIMSFNLTAFFAISFVAALASTVFVVGSRLQRDTEGLV